MTGRGSGGSAIEPTPDGFRLRVRLTPKGGADAIDGPGAGADGTAFLKARVRAAPEKGQANTALEALIAKALGIPKSAVTVDKGATGRLKIVAVKANGEALAKAKALVGQ